MWLKKRGGGMEVRMGVDRQIGGRERGEIKDYYNKSCSIL